MAKRPGSPTLVTCNCPECQGAKIDQTAQLRHRGETKSGVAKMPDRVWMMGCWWVKEEVTNMTCSLRTYSTKELTKWADKLDDMGDDVSRGSADRIRMLLKREAELLFRLKGIRLERGA